MSWNVFPQLFSVESANERENQPFLVSVLVVLVLEIKWGGGEGVKHSR